MKINNNFLRFLDNSETNYKNRLGPPPRTIVLLTIAEDLRESIDSDLDIISRELIIYMFTNN